MLKYKKVEVFNETFNLLFNLSFPNRNKTYLLKFLNEI